jgi:4-amino-4-deoxy-L-arabinose transferase-like glycosyltransferase
MSHLDSLPPETPPLSPLPPKPAAIPAAWRAVLAAVLLSYVLFGAAHIAATPVAPDTVTNYINAPDEAAHLVYVQAVAEKGHIPVRGDRDYPTYEWHQPPLYYSLAAPAYKAGPRAVRWAGLLMGLLGVWVIFLAGRRIFPEDPALAVLASGFASLLPMRQAVTSAIGNDVLIELFFSVTLLVIARAFYSGFTGPRAITLGACIGLAMATKATGILLLPILALALIFLRREGETTGNVLRGGALALAVALLLPAGWFARNVTLYGEITPVKAFMREFETTATAESFIGKRRFLADSLTGEMRPADNITRGQYLGLLSNWTIRTFWASYTPPGDAARLGIPFFLPPSFYGMAALLMLLAGAGAVRMLVNWKSILTATQARILSIAFFLFGLVLASFIGFTWTFFQAQGRYLYPAMLPLALLFPLRRYPSRVFLTVGYNHASFLLRMTILWAANLLRE